MKKRMLIMILAGAMVVTVGLAGCGKSDSKKDNSDSGEEIKVEESSEEGSEESSEEGFTKDDVEKIQKARESMSDEEWDELVDQAFDKAIEDVRAENAEKNSIEDKDSSEATYTDKTLTTKDCIIKITDYKVLKPGESKLYEYGDKPIIAFWYDITNVSGKEMDSTEWMWYVEAYQDNDPNFENKLETGLGVDDETLDTQLQKIKQGGTVKGSHTYELTDDTTPVTLKFTGERLGEVIASEDFPIN